MAQVATSNYPIPNDTGANVRSDINDNLEDLYSTSSGSSAPPAAIDNQLWIDTSTTPDTLKCKQGSSWISLGTISTDLGHAPAASPTFTGNLNLPAGSSGSLPLRVTGDTDTGLFFATNTVNIHAGGTTVHEFTASASTPKVPVRATNASASSPSYSFASDTNTGIYRSSADALAITTGGTNRAIFDSNGLTVKDRKGILLHDTDNSHGVTIKPPGTVSSNYTLTLPGDDGNNNQILKSDGSGNLSWTTVDTLASDAQFLKYQSTSNTGTITFSTDTWTDCLSLTYTPQASSSKIIVTAYLNIWGTSPQASNVTSKGDGAVRILEGSSVVGEAQYLYWGLAHSSSYDHYVTQKQWQFTFHAEYTNTSTSNKTFKVQLYEDTGVMELNGGPGTDEGLSWLTVMEVL
jgi:hypothetical protein